MKDYTDVLGRVLVALLFLLAGIGKLGGAFEGTQGYMEAFGVPGMLLPLVILVEIGGALLLIAGYQTRWTALALAGFSIVSAVIFHSDFGDQAQMTNFLKNLSIAGGLLVLYANGPGSYSLDNRNK
ncbi:MAG: DoxX family protein [Gammaproteobacteria bacterium]|jgi:putative oxidoreductase|nr:DoxX family protein [Gammaproteobacteria bacterium]